MATTETDLMLTLGEYSVPRHNIAYAVAVVEYPDPDKKGIPGVAVHLKHGQRRMLFLEGWTLEGFNDIYNGAPF